MRLIFYILVKKVCIIFWCRFIAKLICLSYCILIYLTFPLFQLFQFYSNFITPVSYDVANSILIFLNYVKNILNLLLS